MEHYEFIAYLEKFSDVAPHSPNRSHTPYSCVTLYEHVNFKGRTIKFSAGRVAARARGRLGGRPEKFGKKEIEMMKALAKNGTPIKDIASMLETSRATVYRYINK